jgi:hypothetical protein
MHIFTFLQFKLNELICISILYNKTSSIYSQNTYSYTELERKES